MLDVRDLVSGYAGIVALRSASLVVPRGAMVCLVGANGAGKSTLLNTVCGLIQARGGSVNFEGADITRKPAQTIARRGLLLVPEGRQIFGGLTVEENLKIGGNAVGDRAGNAKVDLARVFALFPILLERRHQIAEELSGGQQQMLAIGRALMGRPRLLLLDEPSLGLGPVVVNQVYEALRELNRKGLSILVVEQNARRAMEVSNYTYVLDRGNVVLAGPSEKVRADSNVLAHYLGQVEENASSPS
jgi:branched-chain amino acid transport system ATP-binding protein